MIQSSILFQDLILSQSLISDQLFIMFHIQTVSSLILFSTDQFFNLEFIFFNENQTLFCFPLLNFGRRRNLQKNSKKN